jgi:3-oxoacyl-[acyl-carrier-protein] synthase III
VSRRSLRHSTTHRLHHHLPQVRLRGFVQLSGISFCLHDHITHHALFGAHVSKWVVPHQANIRIMEGTARKLGIPVDRLVSTIREHGDTSAASIPIALDQAYRDGRIRRGDKVLMHAVGAGVTWGALAMQA